MACGPPLGIRIYRIGPVPSASLLIRQLQFAGFGELSNRNQITTQQLEARDPAGPFVQCFACRSARQHIGGVVGGDVVESPRDASLEIGPIRLHPVRASIPVALLTRRVIDGHMRAGNTVIRRRFIRGDQGVRLGRPLVRG